MTQELILTKENVGFYLFLRGFLDINEFSKEFYSIKVLIARNLSFQLVHKNGKKFFIKQLCHNGEDDKAAFAFEMAFYEACISHPGFMPVAPLVPRLYLYDPLYGVAVSELLEGFRPVSLITGNPEQVAAALAQIARIPVSTHTNDQRPGLMYPDALNDEILSPVSGNEKIKRAILQLNERWYPGNILHNDLKPGNILVNDRQEVKIIDWEKMSTGDALWDLAALICYALPSDSTVYQAASGSREYLAAQSARLKAITRTYRQEWAENDALRLIQYLGLQILTVKAESKNLRSGRVLLLAADLLLAPEQYLDLMVESYG